MAEHTRDPVNQPVLEVAASVGIASLGLMNNQVWFDDPRRLTFTLARYKFVSKLLSGRKNVLEIGCGDAFCARVVKQEVGDLTCTDYDPLFVADANARMNERWRFTCLTHDILAGAVAGCFDAAYTLDVLEHIPEADEDRFLNNIEESLTARAALIVGMPSLESQAYASPPSRAGHINCKTGADLKALLERNFETVFLFSMNDEVVHTGYTKMAHYLIGVCATKKTDSA